MKKTLLVTVVALLVFAVMAASAAAQGSVSYAVGIQIKNLNDSPSSNTVITYYNQDGSVESTFNIPTIPANGSYTMATLEGVNEGFNGSAIVSSENEIAAIANVFGNGFSGMGASYTAFRDTGTTASLPLILRNHYGFSTWFNVQNAGSTDTTVTVTYNNGATEQATVAPGAANTFNQSGNTNLPDPAGNAGFVGSAVITTSNGEPIVATLMQQGPTTLLGYDGFRDMDASTAPVMPLVNVNNYGYITGIQIQNTGDQATSVTVSYTASLAGTNCTETQSIAAGTSANFTLSAFDNDPAHPTGTTTCTAGQTFIGSATVTANSTDQPLNVIVNQLNSAANKGASYGAFNPANGSSTVELPLIMDRNYGYFTGFSIVNVGSSTTTVTCTYTDSTATNQQSVAPGAALTVVNGPSDTPLGNGYVGAATCTASGGDASIVGIVNELQPNAALDSFLVYEGTNQ